MNPKAILDQGKEIVGQVLRPWGFDYRELDEGLGSGGRFAAGVFRAGDRSLELHFRRSLGLVTYRLGALGLDHVTYMRYLGVYGRNLYPGFSDDPLDGFRGLAHDLDAFCGDFLRAATEFREFALDYSQDPDRFRGFKAF
jgi:hypothetical protein